MILLGCDVFNRSLKVEVRVRVGKRDANYGKRGLNGLINLARAAVGCAGNGTGEWRGKRQ